MTMSIDRRRHDNLSAPMHGAVHDDGTEATRRNVARLLEQEQAARDSGIAMAHPIYALGHPVNQIGRDNFKAFRTEWEARTPWEEIVEGVVKRVAEERRVDVDMPLSGVSAMPDGSIRLNLANGETMRLTRTGLHGMLAQLGLSNGAAYLAEAEPMLLAANLEWHLRRTAPTMLERDGSETVRKLRTRLALGEGEGREVYAVTSQQYRPVDADVLVQQVYNLMPPGARGSFLYDGERMLVEASWFTDIQPEEVCAGEVFRAALQIKARDDRFGGVEISWGVERNLCLNLIILSTAGQVLRIRHTDHNARAKVQQFMETANTALGRFADLWGFARRNRFAPCDMSTIFRGLLRAEHVKLPGLTEDASVDRLLEAFDKEPGYDRAAVINAVTRAAHTNAWRSAWTTNELEEQGGTLLAARIDWEHVAKIGAADKRADGRRLVSARS